MGRLIQQIRGTSSKEASAYQVRMGVGWGPFWEEMRVRLAQAGWRATWAGGQAPMDGWRRPGWHCWRWICGGMEQDGGSRIEGADRSWPGISAVSAGSGKGEYDSSVAFLPKHRTVLRPDIFIWGFHRKHPFGPFVGRRALLPVFSVRLWRFYFSAFWEGRFHLLAANEPQVLRMAYAIFHFFHLGFLVLLQNYFHPVFTLAKTTSFNGRRYGLFLCRYHICLPHLTLFQGISPPTSGKWLHTIGGWWIWGYL